MDIDHHLEQHDILVVEGTSVGNERLRLGVYHSLSAVHLLS